jgi:hypothetical protein
VLWTDPEFPPTDASLFIDPSRPHRADWTSAQVGILLLCCATCLVLLARCHFSFALCLCPLFAMCRLLIPFNHRLSGCVCLTEGSPSLMWMYSCLLYTLMTSCRCVSFCVCVCDKETEGWPNPLTLIPDGIVYVWFCTIICMHTTLAHGLHAYLHALWSAPNKSTLTQGNIGNCWFMSALAVQPF